MPTVLSISALNQPPLAAMGEMQPSSYKEYLKQLAAQAPKPYGAIPPLPKKRKKKTRQQQQQRTQRKTPSQSSSSSAESDQQKPMRRMSHVEDWIVVDSKESLPDEEELISKSPLRNFLSGDFFTEVLPLHMPPPSLSDPGAAALDQPDDPGKGKSHAIPASSSSVTDVQTVDEAGSEEDEEDDDDEEEFTTNGVQRRVYPNWKSDGEEEEEEEDEDDEDDDDEHKSLNKTLTGHHHHHKGLVRRHSISSFSKSQTPSTSTTASYVMSSSPPRHSRNMHQLGLMQTIAQLRRSLNLSSSSTPPLSTPSSSLPSSRPSKKDGFIPMPPAPRRPVSQRRRSEATTQPRFNPETNTYTRDTRSNPDHLRMISSELNMMRARKLLSPLKPRGFLPRRKDPFIRGAGRRESRLRWEIKPLDTV